MILWVLFFKLVAAAAAKSLQSCPTLCDPIDGSPPGSPIPGILQARTLEWVAISFSNTWKWKVKVKSFSCVWLCDPMDCSLPGSSVHGIFQARVLQAPPKPVTPHRLGKTRLSTSPMPSEFFQIWVLGTSTTLTLCEVLRMSNMVYIFFSSLPSLCPKLSSCIVSISSLWSKQNSFTYSVL